MQMQEQQPSYHPSKQLLTCRLCTDIFKKPVTLTCGHTFCYNCLYKFMKQNHFSRPKQKQIQLKKNHQQHENFLSFEVKINEQKESEDSKERQNIPLPLCPQCSSLIVKQICHQFLRPIKNAKENLAIVNLIAHANYKPQIKFENLVYDEEVLNFDHNILIVIESPKIQPLPFAHSQIRFKTCFLDDMLQQSHNSFVVIEWSNFKKSTFVLHKKQILDLQVRFREYKLSIIQHLIETKKTTIEAYLQECFSSMFRRGKPYKSISNQDIMYFFNDSKTQATLYTDEQPQLAPLTICKCEPYHSSNIQHLSMFDPFFFFYDRLSNPHFLNQINQLIDTTPLFVRNNPENIMYACIRILKLPPKERKQIIEIFDDKYRIEKINEFLQKNQHLPVEEFIHISIPGKYNSAFVFGVIFVLILLHYLQTN